MMKRTIVLSAAAAFQAAAAPCAEAFATLMAQRNAARSAAFQAGGTNRQSNSVENVIGSDRLEIELLGVLKSAGLGDLLAVIERAGGTAAIKSVDDLEGAWNQRMAVTALEPFVE